MNYKTIYDDLVKTRDKLERKEQYTEEHHIIPRCLGGSDNKENLVSLTAREHLIAHKLLCRIYPSETKLKIALLYMITSKRYVFIDSESPLALRKRSYVVSSDKILDYFK